MASRAAGFTLIEVLVATVVLMTTVSGVASLTVVAARARVTARLKTMAALIGEREVESLRAGIGGAAGSEYFDASGRSLGSSTVTGAVFVVRWHSSPSPGDAGTSLIRVMAAPIGSDAAAAPLAPSGAPGVVWLVATMRPGS